MAEEAEDIDMPDSPTRESARETVFFDDSEMLEDMPYWKRKAHKMLYSQGFDTCMALVIVLNVILMVVDTDRNSSCFGENPTAPQCDSALSTVGNTFFLVIYILELLLRVFVVRWDFFRDPWNWLDTVIVGIGLIDVTLSDLLNDLLDVPNVQMLRLFRVVRLTRIIKLLKFFPTLYYLVRGFAGAMEAIAWGWALIMCLLMIWSLIAVDLLYPVTQRINFKGDPWCQESMETVVRASLYFMQTLVAGDSWGACALPIMKEEPWSYFIFCGALVTVQLGFTNLILAIIVDKATQARDSDMPDVIKEKKARKMKFMSKLRHILEEIDQDHSGTISLQEMMDGYDKDPHVREALNLMDVDRQDLRMLFQLLGGAAAEEVSYNTFLDLFQKAQLQDMRVYLMVMKLQVQRVTAMVKEIKAEVRCTRGARTPQAGLALATSTLLESEQAVESEEAVEPLPWPRVGVAASVGARPVAEPREATAPPRGEKAPAEASAWKAASAELESLERRLEQQLSAIVREAVSSAANVARQAAEAEVGLLQVPATAVPDLPRPRLLLQDAAFERPKPTLAADLPVLDFPREGGRARQPDNGCGTEVPGATATVNGADEGCREASAAATGTAAMPSVAAQQHGRLSRSDGPTEHRADGKSKNGQAL